MKKLKYAEIKPTREQKLKEQNGICAICGQPVALEQAALDHNHTTGAIRQVLHLSCNAFLGKIENNYRRFGVTDLEKFLSGVASYLERHAYVEPGALVRHPTHKTPEEKKAAAKKKRAKAKTK